jgi:saccharopine dehydrogenase (NAD+, L-lysine-forming)
MRVLVVGSGAVGQVICTALVRASDLEGLKVADINLGKVKQFANWLKDSRVSAHRLDGGNVGAVARLSRGMDVLVNALEPRFNLPLMAAALRARTDYQDMAFGPPYETLDKELKQQARWKKAGLTAITASGNAPGITNIAAAAACDELDSVEGIEIRVASSLFSSEVLATWSPATMIQDMKGEPIVYENGQFKKVPPFSGEETYPFPQPVGPQNVTYHAHEEPHTLGRFINKHIRFVRFKYGVNRLMRELLQIGLLSDKPLTVKGVRVAPLDVVINCYPKPLGTAELSAKIQAGIIKGSVGCDAIDTWGTKDGKAVKYKYCIRWPDILEVNKDMPHATHTSYMAGTGAVVLTEALARGEIETVGVIAPECLDRKIRKAFLTELPKRKIGVEMTQEPTAVHT